MTTPTSAQVAGEKPVWSFEAIAASDPSRATLLDSAPLTEAIADSVLASFESALATERVLIGMEESCSDSSDLRVILQFHVGELLFDRFFNANTGYRAQFRRGWQRGLDYNRRIISSICTLVAASPRLILSARRLTSKFEDCGALEVTREQVSASLDPDMSKVWFCARLIAGGGKVTQLPSGVVGPRLRIDQYTTWAAVTRDEDSAWLEIKGAFVGSDELYQPKDSIARAKKLEASGEA